MSDQKTLIENLICYGSRYDLESCSLAAKVIAEQENLIRKLRSENESGRATISQLKERVALLEAARARRDECRLALAVRIAEAPEWHDECQATLRWAGNWWDRAARHKGMEELEDICRDARREIGQAKWDAWGDVNEDKYKAWGEE